MAFTVTFEPVNRIAGVNPSSADFETAQDAWREVDALMHSDERVTITCDGATISWQELKAMAARGGPTASISDIDATADTQGRVWIRWPVNPGGQSSSHHPDEIDDLIVRLQAVADTARMSLAGRTQG